MNCLLLLVAIVTASSDGEYLQVHVPGNWEHIRIVVDPPCEFVEVGPRVFLGVTEATEGVVHGAVCTDLRCELVEQRFSSVPGVVELPSHYWETVGGGVIFGFLITALYIGVIGFRLPWGTQT